MKLLVKYQVCAQVGPDEWAMITEEKLFDPLTPLQDVYLWVRDNHKPSDKLKWRMPEVKLSEPEQ